MLTHGERKHSKYSASGAERWTNCPGSVALCEALPDMPNKWSIEGTQAHENLEALLTLGRKSFHILKNCGADLLKNYVPHPDVVMIYHAQQAAIGLLKLHHETPDSEFLVETRVSLAHIHSDMFGTFDSALVEYCGVLYVYDYKYGKTVVSPIRNLQMIFYTLALAHKYHYNFHTVRIAIGQPRVPNFTGPVYWEAPMSEIRPYETVFKKAIDTIERFPKKYVAGKWCHWCRGRHNCPLKQTESLEKYFPKLENAF